MKNLIEDEIAQIKAILSYVFVGIDGWVDRVLPAGASMDAVQYEDIFDVSEEDIYDFVRETAGTAGW